MAQALSDVKRRIATTRQLRKVTNTLQKVASARYASSRRQVEQADVYFEKLCDILAKAYHALPIGADRHPLMTRGGGDGIGLIVCGADRGLCGGFNTGLMNEAAHFRAAHAPREVTLFMRGKVVHRRALRLQWSGVQAVQDIDDVITRMMEAFLERSVAEVHVLYWKHLGGIRQELHLERILPTPFTEHATGARAALDADMLEPSPRAIIDRLLPEYVRRNVHNAYFNSMAAENAARQASMARATENAGELITDLSRQYSRLRQESITGEMLELGAGMGAP